MPKTPKKLPTEKTLAEQSLILKNLVATNGGQKRVAETLGVTQAAISKWIISGFVPLRRAVEIEAIYGVPRVRTAHPKLTQTFAPAEFGAV